MKQCNLCSVVKALTEFHRHSSYADGHRSRCKQCTAKLIATPENRAKQLALVKVWQARNPDKVKESQRRFRATHRKAQQVKNAKWRAANPERHRVLVAAWRAANPLANVVYLNRRRTRLAGSGGKHSVAEWKERLLYFNRCCAYCLQPESAVGHMTQEHMTPLVQGGSDDIENIVPACSGCNSSKGRKNLLQFANYGDL